MTFGCGASDCSAELLARPIVPGHDPVIWERHPSWIIGGENNQVAELNLADHEKSRRVGLAASLHDDLVELLHRLVAQALGQRGDIEGVVCLKFAGGNARTFLVLSSLVACHRHRLPAARLVEPSGRDPKREDTT